MTFGGRECQPGLPYTAEYYRRRPLQQVCKVEMLARAEQGRHDIDAELTTYLGR